MSDFISHCSWDLALDFQVIIFSQSWQLSWSYPKYVLLTAGSQLSCSDWFWPGAAWYLSATTRGLSRQQQRSCSFVTHFPTIVFIQWPAFQHCTNSLKESTLRRTLGTACYHFRPQFLPLGLPSDATPQNPEYSLIPALCNINWRRRSHSAFTERKNHL